MKPKQVLPSTQEQSQKDHTHLSQPLPCGGHHQDSICFKLPNRDKVNGSNHAKKIDRNFELTKQINSKDSNQNLEHSNGPGIRNDIMRMNIHDYEDQDMTLNGNAFAKNLNGINSSDKNRMSEKMIKSTQDESILNTPKINDLNIKFVNSDSKLRIKKFEENIKTNSENNYFCSMKYEYINSTYTSKIENFSKMVLDKSSKRENNLLFSDLKRKDEFMQTFNNLLKGNIKNKFLKERKIKTNSRIIKKSINSLKKTKKNLKQEERSKMDTSIFNFTINKKSNRQENTKQVQQNHINHNIKEDVKIIPNPNGKEIKQNHQIMRLENDKKMNHNFPKMENGVNMINKMKNDIEQVIVPENKGQKKLKKKIKKKKIKNVQRNKNNKRRTTRKKILYKNKNDSKIKFPKYSEMSNYIKKIPMLKWEDVDPYHEERLKGC